ncbi:MAG: VanZ family protein [Thermoanaerobaculia bacterium]|nr:VanZ family protein [Thermoanaerobaculia bacterium]MBP9825110.1 VanZ family protein [Thermoanaerobaculia bacterium]
MPLPRHFVLHLVSLAFAIAIAFALIEPVPVTLETATQGMTFPIDKLVHFGLFLVAAVPWRRSLAVAGVPSPGVAVVVAAAAYGGLLEIVQGLFTARDAELLDMAAGALGAAVAVGLLRWVRPPKVPA